jgi:hypothetical protein
MLKVGAGGRCGKLLAHVSLVDTLSLYSEVRMGSRPYASSMLVTDDLCRVRKE